MHELALADAIVDVAVRHAEGRRVTKVEVRVGHLRQVVPGALEFAFELVAEGTAAEGAELVLEHVPVRVVCRDCGREEDIDDFPLACPRCGAFDVEVVAGEELSVEALDLDDEPVLSGRR